MNKLTLSFTSLLAAVSFLLGGCAGFDISKATPYAGDTAFTVTAGLMIASKNPAGDAVIIRNVATKIQSLTTGTVITPEQFQAELLTVIPKNDTRWISLVNGLTRIYRRVQPMIKTDYSAYLNFLNVTSTGILDAVAGY